MMTYKYYDTPRSPQSEIFVFGSNLRGRHGKGTARWAFMRYGAIYGRGIGHHNESYAIPTKDGNLNILELHDIVPYIHQFVQYTIDNPHLRFYVTPVGTGLADYDIQDIAPHFRGAINCEFPRLFQHYLESEELVN